VVEETRLYRHEVIQQYGKKTLKKIEEYTGTFKTVNDSRVDEERFKDLGGIHFMIDDDKNIASTSAISLKKMRKTWIFTFCGEEVLTDKKTPTESTVSGWFSFMLAHRLIGRGISTI